MSIRIPRSVALGAATCLAAGSVSVLGVTAAHADSPTQIGTLTVNPATGADDTLMSVVTSGACTQGTNIQTFVYGQGFPADGYAVTLNQVQSTFPPDADGHLTIPLSDTMRSFAQKNGFAALTGQYDLHVRCRTKISSAGLGDFVGSIVFDTPTSYTFKASGPVSTRTTTTLAVTPNGSAGAGSAVTLTATVSPAAAGTVQFLDGTAALGSPVPVAGGQAALTVNTLAQGAHSLSAVFTSTDAAFTGSTSAATSYTISPPSAVNTTTSLAVTPGGSAAKGSSVKLAATVAPAAADGSVQFFDKGTLLGTQPVSGGAAEYSTTTLAEGDHQLTAAYVPADSTKYAASTSTAVAFTVTPVVTPPGGGSTPPSPVGETITTTVAPGALVISVAGSNVTLPPLALNNTSTLFSTVGPLQTVTVTDTRAGAPGWSVSGQVAQFTSGANAINAENLGWAPNLVAKGDALKVTLGGSVDPANAVEAGDAGVLGLKSSRTLATATGLGTAKLGADLTLLAPTSTQAGTYQGVLTLTAI